MKPKQYCLTYYTIYILLLTLIFTSDFLFSQSSYQLLVKSDELFKYSIDFSDRKPLSKVNSINIFSSQNEAEPGSPVLDENTLFFALPPGQKVIPSLVNQKVKIHDKYYPQINPKITFKDSVYTYEKAGLDKKYFTNDLYPGADVELQGYLWIKDIYCCAIKVNVFRYNWKKSQLNELLSGDLVLRFTGKPVSVNPPEGLKKNSDPLLKEIIFNYNDAYNYISQINNITGNYSDSWIDYNQEYYKLAIPEDGIYHITYDDLIKYGINPSAIDPLTIKIYQRGKQIPLFVEGEDDGVFNNNEYVEFWAEKNYGAGNYRDQVPTGKDYLNYYDRYNDTTFIWLTFNGERGMRVKSQDSQISSAPDTINSQVVKLHFEQDRKILYYDGESPRTQLPFWQENKNWIWYESWELNNKKAFDFYTDNIVPNSKVKTYVRAISYAAPIVQPVNDHNLGVSFNSSGQVNSLLFNKNQTVTFKSEFNSSLLTQGANKINIHNIETGITPNTFLLDWFDIEYSRYLTANYNNPKYSNDSIYFSINDSISQVIKSIKLSNITGTNIILYKVKPIAKRFDNLKLLGGDLKYMVFGDTLTLGDSFYFTNESLIKHPKLLYKKRFLNIRNNQEGADYIIISNNILRNSVELYKNFIKESYKLRSSAFYVGDIFDEFNYGYKDPQAIKDFLYYAYNNWQYPHPSYLFLIGEANYDYKNKWLVTPAEKVPDLVTAFGFPASDTWYVCFDSLNINIPQLYVGRIPVENDSQVLAYLNKHKEYLSRNYDEWNKRIILFSGGFVDKPGEIESLKAANDIVKQEFLNSPLGASVIHFYKTTNPLSNFGPYPYEVVKNTIDAGAIYISYLGHSGTKTWDNGINSTDQLINLVNGSPLMTDFGCSTGKFAEPDIQSFSELFVSRGNGQAIVYCGNSSLGFLSLATSFPPIFANRLLDTASFSLGEVHFLSKMKLFQQNGGFTDVNRVFNYCNVLIGDPVIKIKFPAKPNLYVKNNSITTVENNLNDKMEYCTLRFSVCNDGKTFSDSVRINLSDNYKGKIIFNKIISIKCPVNSDSVEIKVPVLNLPGQHNLLLTVDSTNIIDEMNEDDNTSAFTLNVYSLSLRIAQTENLYNFNKHKLVVLNPIIKNGIDNRITFAIDTSSGFSNPLEINVGYDSLYTSYKLNNLTNDKRYWWKAKLTNSNGDWSQSSSFYNGSGDFNWYFAEPLNDVNLQNIEYNNNTKKWGLTTKQNQLRIISAGGYDGSTAIIEYNGEDKVGANLWGLATAVLDPVTLEPIKVVLFKSGGINLVDSLASYINKMPDGTIIAMAIGTEARNYILGQNAATSASRKAIKLLGSKFIDQVGYRESWAIIGKKGAPTGSVPEVYHKILEGQAEIDTTFMTKYSTGNISLPGILNVSSWDSLKIKSNGNVNYFLIGNNNTGIIDTIGPLSDQSTSLHELNKRHFSNLRIKIDFLKDSVENNPTVEYVKIKYAGNSELTTNYQVVSVSKDSLTQGDSLSLKFFVYNVGETPADSFNVKVELVKPDNSTKILTNAFVSEVDSMQHKEFNLTYRNGFYDGSGNMKFRISIDPDNKIQELFKDNNVYEIPFYVIKDTTPTSVTSATVSVTFDGINIIDGDYVSSAPEISFTLSYPVWFPVYDSTAVKFLIDDKPVSRSLFDIYSDTINRKAIFKYKPILQDGGHKLEIFGENITGAIDNTPGYKVSFNVSDELKIMNVFNYPNPFKDNTNFTFILTQVPDDLKIKIYTVAGRLIKEISNSKYPVHAGYNTIPWDGKDADGDAIANGTYIYKMIVKKEGKSQSYLQKITVIR